MLQILKEFENRTEYKVLKSFEECRSCFVYELNGGNLVIPGIVLERLSKEQMNSLFEWTEQYHNQLIVLPAWAEMSLQDYIKISVPIEIIEIKSEYMGLPITYHIRSSIKDILFETDSKIFGIHCRRNVGSGLITIITLPILDYRLIEHEVLLKKFFRGLINPKEQQLQKSTEEVDFYPKEIHLQLMLLIGSGAELRSGYLYHLNKYFRISLSDEQIKLKINELISNGYLDGDRLAGKGVQFINETRMKAFMRIIKERELIEDGWK